MSEEELTNKEKEIYERGVQDGFNQAAYKVMEAFGIDLEKYQLIQPEEEFLNKP